MDSSIPKMLRDEVSEEHCQMRPTIMQAAVMKVPTQSRDEEFISLLELYARESGLLNEEADKNSESDDDVSISDDEVSISDDEREEREEKLTQLATRINAIPKSKFKKNTWDKAMSLLPGQAG